MAKMKNSLIAVSGPILLLTLATIFPPGGHLAAQNAQSPGRDVYFTIDTKGMTHAGQPAGFPVCEVSGTFVGFNWKDEGFVVLSAKPFPGATRVGQMAGYTLKFRIEGLGDFELRTREFHPEPIPIWGLLDRSFKKGKSFACYASIKNPMECEGGVSKPQQASGSGSPQSQDASGNGTSRLLQQEIQANVVKIAALSQDISSLAQGRSATPLAHCAPCCTGTCCGINPDGTCWASDTCRPPTGN
jgi:hypothetical protein